MGPGRSRPGLGSAAATEWGAANGGWPRTGHTRGGDGLPSAGTPDPAVDRNTSPGKRGAGPTGGATWPGLVRGRGHPAACRSRRGSNPERSPRPRPHLRPSAASRFGCPGRHAGPLRHAGRAPHPRPFAAGPSTSSRRGRVDRFGSARGAGRSCRGCTWTRSSTPADARRPIVPGRPWAPGSAPRAQPAPGRSPRTGGRGCRVSRPTRRETTTGDRTT